MHLITEDPTKGIKKALDKKKNTTSNPVAQFTPALNNIRGKQYKKEEPLKKKPTHGYKIPATPKVSGVKWGG